MDSKQVQTPVNKNSEFDFEFVQRATEIIDQIYEQIDKCCLDCQAILKSGLKPETPGPQGEQFHGPQGNAQRRSSQTNN